MLNMLIAGLSATFAFSAQEAELTRADMDIITDQAFEAADADGDQAVTEAEYVASIQGSVTAMGDDGEMSTDASVTSYLKERFVLISQGDGTLSKEELKIAIDDDFSTADQDGDDVLIGEEVQTFASLRTGDSIGQ
ncbi:MAG: hypothetical protein AAGA69_01030 [Pseudomonadota bacterium]